MKFKLKLPSLLFLLIPAVLVGGFVISVGYKRAGIIVIFTIFGFWILPEIFFSKTKRENVNKKSDAHNPNLYPIFQMPLRHLCCLPCHAAFV